MCPARFGAMREIELPVERLPSEGARRLRGPASTAGGAVPAPLDGRALVGAVIGRRGEEPKARSAGVAWERAL